MQYFLGTVLGAVIFIIALYVKGYGDKVRHQHSLKQMRAAEAAVTGICEGLFHSVRRHLERILEGSDAEMEAQEVSDEYGREIRYMLTIRFRESNEALSIDIAIPTDGRPGRIFVRDSRLIYKAASLDDLFDAIEAAQDSIAIHRSARVEIGA